MSERGTKEIIVDAYKGAAKPRVELGAHNTSDAENSGTIDGPLSISLESIDSEMHNQSYGMISASTGCISNIGGPSC